MKVLLVINSSASGAHSASRVLVEHAVAEFAKANAGARIVRRDVGEAPIRCALKDSGCNHPLQSSSNTYA